MRHTIFVSTFVFLSILVAACSPDQASLVAEGQPALEPEPTVTQPPVEAVSLDTTPPTPTPKPPTATPEAPTSTPELPTSTPGVSSGSDSLAVPTSTPTSIPATHTPTLVPAPPAPAAEPIGVPAPQLVEYDGANFLWEWDGLEVLAERDWYFDIKIFYNATAEFPYDVLVAEPQSVGHNAGVWSFGGRPNFECGSYWAAQIAERNPDGSYAGPLSPESNRLPVKFGCRDNEDPCPNCGD